MAGSVSSTREWTLLPTHSGPWPLYYLLVDFSFQWSLANSVLWCCETTDTTLLEIIIGVDKRSFQDTN